MIREYSAVYLPIHDQTTGMVETARSRIDELQRSPEFATLTALDTVAALQPPVSVALRKQLAELRDAIFVCPNASRTAVAHALRTGPVHTDCGLTLETAAAVRQQAADICRRAEALVVDALAHKVKVLCHPSVRELLEQGRHEPDIAALLDCPADALASHLMTVLPRSPSLVERINHYTRRISVKHVSLAAFRPHNGTIRRDEVAAVVGEFRHFLEAQFGTEPDDATTVHVLQLE